MDPTPSHEFIFLRDEIEKIARLLLSDEENNIREALFKLGCLHNICHQNSVIFKYFLAKSDLHAS